MPCYRCDARQTDPVRGTSPWRRGVVADELVLVCPDCQRAHDWAGDLDRCATCGSTALARALGDTRCRSCGAIGPGVPAAHRPAARASQHAAAVDAGTVVPGPVGQAADSTRAVDGPSSRENGAAVRGLADEVAAALERLRGGQP